jgi:hypothetical protein
VEREGSVTFCVPPVPKTKISVLFGAVLAGFQLEEAEKSVLPEIQEYEEFNGNGSEKIVTLSIPKPCEFDVEVVEVTE